MKRFELVFAGSADAEYRFPRYRRMHESLESARETARQVWQTLQQRNLPTACHAPLVYGPGCGETGISVQPW